MYGMHTDMVPYVSMHTQNIERAGISANGLYGGIVDSFIIKK